MKGEQDTFQKRDFNGFLQILRKDQFKYFENGLHLFDEAKDIVPVIVKGGGDLKSYFFYKLNTFSLDYFIGTNVKKDRQYMPRHEGLNNILTDNLGVFKYFSCKSGQQLR